MKHKNIIKRNHAWRWLILALTLILCLLSSVAVLALHSLAGAAHGAEKANQAAFMGMPKPPTKGNESEIDLSGYSHDLIIYNYLVYSDSEGNPTVGAGGYKLTGDSAVSVSIGDQGEAETPPPNPNTNPIDSNILVTLDNLTMPAGKTLTVKKVFDGAKSVSMTASGASSVSQFTVESGAALTLDLSDDFSIGTLHIGNGASVTINLGAKTLTVGSITGGGKLEITASGTLNIEGAAELSNFTASNAVINLSGNLHAAGDIDLSSVTLSGSAGDSPSVTAGGDISVSGGTVQNLAFFGFPASVTGLHTLALSSNASFNNVPSVGAAENCNAVIRVSGSENASFTGSVLRRDFSLAYNDGAETITPAGDWAVYYRVSENGGTSSVIGSLTENAGSYTYASAPNTGVALPDYSKTGYIFHGWKINDSDAVSFLPAGSTGDLNLTASFAAKAVHVTFDLGYAPNEYTNDSPLPDRITTQESSFDATITLDTPFRFGYEFKGWIPALADGAQGPAPLCSGTYTINNLSYLTENGAGDGYNLSFTAQWQEAAFPLRMQISLENAEISVNNGTDWQTIQAFANANPTKVTYEQTTKVLTFTEHINFNETLSVYFTRAIGGFPILRDASANNEHFAGWVNLSGVHAEGNTAFSLESGLLNKGSQTLAEYQVSLNSDPLMLKPQWGAALYSLSVPTLPTGWTALINGAEQDLPAENGSLTVPEGALVSFRCGYSSPMGFSVWKLTEEPSHMPFNPIEREYNPGDQYIFYDFTMPHSDVTATYRQGEALLINLFESPITFAENVSHNNRVLKGFWYDKDMAIMTPTFKDETTSKYFYAWDFALSFYVTSENQQTQNPLTLVNAMTVYLVRCDLAATNAYSSDLVDRKMDGEVMESKAGASVNHRDWTAYANILIDNSVNKRYTTTLYFKGENTVAGIFQKNYDRTHNTYGALNLHGVSDSDNPGKVKLGSAWGNMDIKAYNLTIEEYDNIAHSEHQDKCEYLFWGTHDNESCDNYIFNTCTVNIPNKRIYTLRGSIMYRYNTHADIGSSRQYSYTYVYDTSYLRVRGDLLGAYTTVNIQTNASLVVDGNILTTYSHWTAGAYIDTTGYVIVKGNRFEGEVFKLVKGTVITNALILGRGCDIKGGTLITNQLINAPCKYPVVNNDGSYDFTGTGSTEDANRNGDNYPFLTRSQNNSTPYRFNFSGGNIYLFGHYKTNDNQSGSYKYDLTVNATDADNPLAAVISPLIDDTGDLAANPTAPTDNDLKTAVNNAGNSDKECLVFGNSSYIVGKSKERVVNCTGTKFYAAGNMTFYNDTTISGGSIICSRLASKRDLKISGGMIEAKEIGSAYNLTAETPAKLTRWQEVVITGGNVKTDRIGALSGSHPDNTEPKSTVIISGVNITPLTEGETLNIVHDVYINYLATPGFTLPEVPAQNPRSLRFEGAAFDSLTLSADVNFQPPAFGNNNGFWMLDKLGGSKINKVNTAGKFLEGDNEIQDTNAYNRELIALYAAKQNYNLEIKAGWESMPTATAGGAAVNFDENHIASVEAGKQVVLTVDSAMTEKTVIWYYDGAGVLHNTLPEIDTANHTLTFTMPYADTEIWITNELSLYLNKYELAFTSEGFRVEWEETREDSAFKYKGNIRVKEENVTVGTSNKIKFEAGSGNDNESNSINIKRDIILDNLWQHCPQGEPGTHIEDGEKVRLHIAGDSSICQVQLPENASLKVVGVQVNAGADLPKIAFRGDSLYNSYSGISSPVYRGKTGAVTFENLEYNPIHKVQSGEGEANCCNLVWSYVMSPNDVVFKNVKLVDPTLDSASSLVSRMQDVVIDSCDFDIKTQIGYTAPPFMNCKTVTIKGNSNIKFTYGSPNKAYPFFSYITEKCTIEDNSKVTLVLELSPSGYSYYQYRTCAPLVELKGNSELKADRRLQLKSLTLEGNSKVIIGDETTGIDGYLLCKEIAVGGSAEIDTDYLIVSGMYVSPDAYGIVTKDDFIRELQAGTNNIYSGGKLDITGGKVVAREFVGGDRNAKINISGGELHSKAIGTCGKLFGFAQYIPKVDEEYVYTYEMLPPENNQTEINISGGVVEVAENGCLGGMRSQVNVSGGKVTLADDAVLGLTSGDCNKLVLDASAHGQTLTNSCAVNITGGTVESAALTEDCKGSVSAPYGAITVSGTAKVNVYDMTAAHGSVTVSETKGVDDKYDNPYTNNKDDDYVGVLVRNRLLGQNVTVQNGAVVYAKDAFTETSAGETGTLSVKYGVNGEGAQGSFAHLYIGGNYGVLGDGNGDVNVEDEEEPWSSHNHIYGIKQYLIKYILNDDEIDPATNPEANPKNYVQGSGDNLPLHDATRHGYNFAGWYEHEDFTGDAVTSIATGNNKDITLYAKWTPKQIEFQIYIDTEMLSDLADNVEGIAGTYDSTTETFTFDKMPKVDYRDIIIGAGDGHIFLGDFALTTYSATALSIKDDRYNNANEEAIDTGSTATAALLDAYLRGDNNDKEPIKLRVTAIARNRLKISFHLNLEQGRPIDSAFSDNSQGTELSEYGEVQRTLAEVPAFMPNNEFISATAPGYEFGGWYTDAGCSEGNKIEQTYQILPTNFVDFYAKWTPKTYLVKFDAGDGNIITKENIEPDESGDSSFNGNVVYDTVIDGGIEFDSVEHCSLPFGWCSGKIFLGWSYDETSEHIIDASTELNLTDIPTGFNVNPEQFIPALTLHAVYRNINVTYNTNGGEWKKEGFSGSPTVQNDLNYGDPLAGYTKNTTTTPVSYEIVSTTADYYNTNHTYAADDYRHSIMNKGYTFGGWFTDQDFTDGTEVKTLPRFNDVEVYAKWSPNSYTVNLKSKDAGRPDGFYHTTFNNPDANQTFSVTVGTRIEESEGNTWPSVAEDTDWYVYNNGTSSSVPQNERRLLLGFTFNSLDPGDTRQDNEGYTAYQTYAASVLTLQNKRLLFKCKQGTEAAGTVFRLPSNDEYNPNIIAGTKTVPDYPNGCTIDLFGVYRERSLVFVERVDTGNGVEEKILAAYPWQDWVNYPDQYLGTDSYRHWTDMGYKLDGWYVNGKTAGAAKYPDNADDYNSQKDDWKRAAADLGTYDIMVYTLYVPEVTVKNVVLTAKTDARNPNDVSTTYEWTLPTSLQQGKTNYTILNNTGLNLVTYADLESKLYNNSDDWDDTQNGSQNADNCAAIKVEFFNPEGELQTGKTKWLTQQTTAQTFTDFDISKGWKILFTLYHAWVIKTQQNFTFDIEITFDDIDGQKIIFDDMIAGMRPSVYQVTYRASIPDAAEVTDTKGFVKTGEYYTKTVDVPYGSNLLNHSQLPAATGYAGSGTWKWDKTSSETAETAAYGSPFNMGVSADINGVLTLDTEYNVANFELSAEQAVLDHQTVTYGTTGSLTDTNPAHVPYNTEVKFTPIGDTYPEFINLTIGEDAPVRLDKYDKATQSGNVYTFPMPAANVHASYNDMMTLYLEEGTISIDEDSYTQNGVEVIWHGGYNILMDANNNADNSETANVLNLLGDLSEREINLGKLNITSADSISLAAAAKAELTAQYNDSASTIQGENISVPETGELTMKKGSAGDGKLILAPGAGCAAIGGNNTANANGKLTLNGLEIEMTMPAGSAASGIGAGGAETETGGKEIALTDCKVTVTEVPSASGVYSGAWIGGKGVESVSLTNTNVNPAAAGYSGNSKILEGKAVTLTGSTVGTETLPAPSAIHAENELNFNGSTVYQNLTSGYPIGTEASGTVNVKGASKIDSKVSQWEAGIYTGKLIIESASDDVVIAGRQILETANGDITITDTQVTQGTANHLHTDSYLLIHDKEGSAAPKLTVTSIAGGKDIMTRTVTLGAVAINADTTVKLEGDLDTSVTLTLSGTVTVADGKKLTVNAGKEENTVALTDSFANSGAYEQTNGKFNSTNAISCAALDMTLTDVTAVLPSLGVHNLTLKDGSVTANADGSKVGSLGDSGVTRVTIDGTTVTAVTIGALGAQDITFTFVEYTEPAAINGTLIRDHYRLAYDLGGRTDYNADNLPKVLRGTTPQDGTEETEETFYPVVPGAPNYTGTPSSAFKNWYVIEPVTGGTGKLWALKESGSADGFEHTLNALTAAQLDWAAEETADGTRTLTLHAWISNDIAAVIKEGRLFEALTGTETAVSIPADYAWTAMFTTDAILPGISYQFKLPQGLPAGTRLTLGVLAENAALPVFYHYELTSDTTDETMLKLSDFVRMGKNGEHPADPEAKNRYLLAVDFAGNKTAQEQQTVTFEMLNGAASVLTANVKYTRTAPPAASLTATDSGVTVSWAGDTRLTGKKLWLAAQFSQDIPYNAQFSLKLGDTQISGDRISETAVVFELSENAAAQLSETTYTCVSDKLKSGSYGVTWYLLAAENTPNVFGRELAETNHTYAITATEPSLCVQLTEPADSRVLEHGTEHVLKFTVDTNQDVSDITVISEKQSDALATFTAVNEITNTPPSDSSDQWTVTMPNSLSAGTYRIRFSILEGFDYDDVFFTVIIE